MDTKINTDSSVFNQFIKPDPKVSASKPSLPSPSISVIGSPSTAINYPPAPIAADVFEKSNKDSKKNVLKPIVIVTSLVAVASGIALALKGKKNVEVDSLKELLKTFKNDMQEFPLDIPYREKIVVALGDKNILPEAIRSVIGPQEYTKILTEFGSSAQNYSPGSRLVTEAKDGFDFVNKEKGLYRANLHMHTLNSDGRMSIRELLDQASEYANFVVSKFDNLSKAKHAPFTVAITDHDTVAGCREAVEIISKNPEKYKNLRVVLGCEMSVENRTLSKSLKSPINTHMLLHGINPFDEELSRFLSTKIDNRIAYAKEMLQQANEVLKKSGIKTDLKFDYEDAKGLYPALKNGITHMCLSSKDYVQFRTIFSECFEKSNEIQQALVKKGIDPKSLSYITPKEKYFGLINENFGNEYWKKYHKALAKYLAELLEVPEENAAGMLKVNSKLKNFFNDVSGEIMSYGPKMNDLHPAYVDMSEALEFMKKQEYGYVGIAHPAIMKLDNYLANADDSKAAMKEIITKFKEKGADKAKFIEMHYHYFGKNWVEDSSTLDWQKLIKDTSEKNGYLFSGSLDTHGTSIFCSG